jgi:hypothetical protein
LRKSAVDTLKGAVGRLSLIVEGASPWVAP